jgi:hypothetical protein
MSPCRAGATFLAVFAMVVAGCADKETAPVPAAVAGRTAATPSPPPLTNLPASMTVKQRSTTPIPGSGEAVRLTIDDITRGQVMASLASKEGLPIMSQTSLSQGQSVTFLVNDARYVLHVTELNNALIGDDFASFEITEAGSSTLTEKEKIDRLIEHVAGLEGATFIRNGEKHTPAQAAEHLRLKLSTLGDSAVTARGFIQLMATKSSLTGEPYEIILENGSTVSSGDYLKDQLERMESKAAATPASPGRDSR